MVNSTECVVICAGALYPALNRIDEVTDGYTSIHFVGLDRGALFLIEAGYSLAMAIGDFDSIAPDELQLVQRHSKDFRHLLNKTEDTDTEIGLQMTIEAFPDADYYLFGALGSEIGRVDHLLANIWLAYQPRFADKLTCLHIVNQQNYLRFIKPGRHVLTSRSTKYFSVITLTPVKGLTIQGAKYNLATCDLAIPRALVSNEFVSDNQAIQLAFEAGLILLIWADEADKTWL